MKPYRWARSKRPLICPTRWTQRNPLHAGIACLILPTTKAWNTQCNSLEGSPWSRSNFIKYILWLQVFKTAWTCSSNSKESHNTTPSNLVGLGRLKKTISELKVYLSLIVLFYWKPDSMESRSASAGHGLGKVWGAEVIFSSSDKHNRALHAWRQFSNAITYVLWLTQGFRDRDPCHDKKFGEFVPRRRRPNSYGSRNWVTWRLYFVYHGFYSTLLAYPEYIHLRQFIRQRQTVRLTSVGRRRWPVTWPLTTALIMRRRLRSMTRRVLALVTWVMRLLLGRRTRPNEKVETCPSSCWKRAGYTGGYLRRLCKTLLSDNISFSCSIFKFVTDL